MREFGSVWVAQMLENELGSIGLVDAVAPPDAREAGPSVGEYFFFTWANRMIEPCSRNAMETFWRRTAVQQIHPVDTGELNSERYWDKWDHVGESAVQEIARRFFHRVVSLYGDCPQGVLFDMTNYYTFMASKTKSGLARRGKNKEGRDNLRQIGVAFLVDRATGLPLYYKAYPGNTRTNTLFCYPASCVLMAFSPVRQHRILPHPVHPY